MCGIAPLGSAHSVADYQEKLATVAADLEKLAKVSGKATKLTLGKKVSEAEEVSRNYFGSKYACFLDNWTGGMA